MFSGDPSPLNIPIYIDYIKNIYYQNCHKNNVDLFISPYLNVLQTPLQPLYDNLTSQTYEIFEKDPIKYKLYEKAIHNAIIDKSKNSKNKKPTVVFIVGAGRGPIVKAAIRASEKAKIPINLYALDKNPNALVVLKHLNKTIWKNQVKIVHSDMRFFNPSEKADIIVSELLGSWGDNELSPECLDGAQNLLKKGGISIPRKYTSYLVPVNCQTVYSSISQKFGDEIRNREMMYVLKMSKKVDLSDIKECFSFEHPNKLVQIQKKIDDNEENKIVYDNSRFESLDFKVKENSDLNGFVGYFDCQLYKDVLMSIHPKTHSKGMFSWFPVFFPIHEPILCKKGETISLNFWRNISTTKVWYEWSLSSPKTTNIHNSQGKSYSINLM